MKQLGLRYCRVILLAAACLLSSCSRFHDNDAVKYEEQHGPFSGTVVSMSISRKVLDQAVSRGGSFNSLRMVEVFHRADEIGTNPTPQYRLFDIQKGSIYDLVGLQTGDILLAADGMIVYEPQGFKTYISTVLRAVPDGTISELFISRGGVPLRFRIKTVA